jgi:GntR family transcriptional repressor for pyruvate dehydrogenase complex
MGKTSVVALEANRPAPKARFRVLRHKDDLVERVVQKIQGQVLDGRLPVGSRLPPEREFAERLGVSRTVVREAVRILVTKGLLETRHGIGTTVRATTSDEVAKPMTLFFRRCNQEVSIEALHQVRSILEVESASLAAQQGTAEDIEDLRKLCAEMDAAAQDPNAFAEKDAEFHRCLGQTTHNPLITLLLDSIRDLLTEVRTRVAEEPGLYERVMPGHRRILDAVAARDAKGARLAMREHLTTALNIQKHVVLELKK